MSFQQPEEREDIYQRLSQMPASTFLTAQLTAGLKDLYVRLRVRKHQTIPTDYCSQTNEKGQFQPCQPVPLLAGRYQYLEILGEGQSAVLVAARDTYQPDNKFVAVKVMHTAYKALGAQECDLMRQICKLDPNNVCRVAKLQNSFMFGQHFCLVLDYLRPRPLHKYFKAGKHESEETKLNSIRKIAQQLVGVLGFLSKIGIIHADLKPENILFENGKKKIKVVDFGNAIRCTYTELSMYYDDFALQTLLYRAPEVMFGVPFGTEIDMWSVGCILAELYLGKPLFTGRNNMEMMEKMVDLLGPLPRAPFKSGKYYQELSKFTNSNIFNPECLIPEFKVMKKLNNSRNFQFANLLVQLLQYDPRKRLTPAQAAQHPFLAGPMPVAFIMPSYDDFYKGQVSPTNYPSILLSEEHYTMKPFVSQERIRHHFNSIELLRSGTSDTDHTTSIGVPDQNNYNTSSTGGTTRAEDDLESRTSAHSSQVVSTTTHDPATGVESPSTGVRTTGASTLGDRGHHTEGVSGTADGRVNMTPCGISEDRSKTRSEVTPVSVQGFTADHFSKQASSSSKSGGRKAGANSSFILHSPLTRYQGFHSPTSSAESLSKKRNSQGRKRPSDCRDTQSPRKKTMCEDRYVLVRAREQAVSNCGAASARKKTACTDTSDSTVQKQDKDRTSVCDSMKREGVTTIVKSEHTCAPGNAVSQSSSDIPQETKKERSHSPVEDSSFDAEVLLLQF